MQKEMQMNQQDVTLLSEMMNQRERQISDLSERVQRVTQENIQLKRQLQRATRDNDQLKRKLQDDPLYNIFSNTPTHPSISTANSFASYSQLQHNLTIYHQQIQSNARQILLLRTNLTQKEKLIIQQQQKLLRNDQYQRDLERENSLLKVQLQSLGRQVMGYRNVVEAFQQRLNHERHTIQQLKHNIQLQNKQDNHQITKATTHFATIAQQWTRISHHVLKRIKQPIRQSLQQSQLKQLNNRQKLIMEDLGREMDERNEIIGQLKQEVMRLRKESDKGIEYDAERHTMREMVENAKLIEERYKQMVERFRHMVQALAKSAEDRQQLRRQYLQVKSELQKFSTQRDQINALKTQYENYKNLYEKTMQSLRFLEQNMVQVLTENEALHNFMYKSRGSKVYMEAIAEELRKYELQQREREQEYKWANVTQLINMNIKLTNRIRQKA